MPLQQTSGNVTADAYGVGAAAVVPTYIEDVFSTWLYTGNGSTQTITNGIDLSGKGGLVWIKDRSAVYAHNLVDTVRGRNKVLYSNSTVAEQTSPGAGDDITSFNANGFSVGANYNGSFNLNTNLYASWTFREQAKFFDVVTYTGTGANRTIAHALGSVPGCIMVKRTDTTGDWQVYHSSLANTQYMVLNTTAAVATGATRWNSTTPTSSVFSVGTDATVNASGGTYVAYVFASNAGGFGLTGTDNVISCGSWTSTGSEVSVTLGYEPQWLLYKRASGGTGNWAIADNMRGVPTGSASSLLNANLTAAEAAGTNITFSATGFSMSVGTAGDVWIYIAIRRGPMKVPTDGAKVFLPVTQTSTGSAQSVTTNFPVDFTISRVRGSTSANYVIDRLRGSTSASARILISNTTDAEYSGGPGFSFDSNTQITDNGLYGAGSSVIYECFQRAPGFFDEVCYTGTGANTTQAHNLGVVPELMIVKCRSSAVAWGVYSAALGNTGYLELNTSAGNIGPVPTAWNSTTPTSTVFSLGSNPGTNYSGQTMVAYLFATCAGVSKVGTYTGNGTTQAIACGFTGGARFVLIKATSTTGNWLTFDTARGMTVLTDPVLSLNSTAAESATLGACTTTTGGFTVNEAILSGVNTSGVSYIFLSVA